MQKSTFVFLFTKFHHFKYTALHFYKHFFYRLGLISQLAMGSAESTILLAVSSISSSCYVVMIFFVTVYQLSCIVMPQFKLNLSYCKTYSPIHDCLLQNFKSTLRSKNVQLRLNPYKPSVYLTDKLTECTLKFD